MPSPVCLVKFGASSFLSTINGANVVTGAVVTIKLDSPSGVDAWAIACVGTDQTLIASAITTSLVIDPLLKTATFVMPGPLPKAIIFESIVNGGYDLNGRKREDYRTTFGIYSTTLGGDRVIAVNETTESDSVFGWSGSLNRLIASGGGGGPPPLPPASFDFVGFDDTIDPLVTTISRTGPKIFAIVRGNFTSLQLPSAPVDKDEIVLKWYAQSQTACTISVGAGQTIDDVNTNYFFAIDGESIHLIYHAGPGTWRIF